MSFNKKRHRPLSPQGKPHYHHRPDGQDGPIDETGAPQPPQQGQAQPPAQPQTQGQSRPQGQNQNRPQQGQPQSQNRPQGQGPRPQGQNQNRPQQGQPQSQNRPQGQGPRPQGQNQNRPQQGQPQSQNRPQGQGPRPQGQNQNRPQQGQPQGQNRPQQQGGGFRPPQNRDGRTDLTRKEPPRKIYPPVNLSDEIKDQLGLNGLEASKKIQELEKEEHICPLCEKPIEGLIYALKHEPTGQYAHFDCIVGEFQKQKPDLQQKGRKIYYVGSGNFAVVKELFDKRGRFRGYTVLEKLSNEPKE
ncbi:MAG: hypothetical protein A2Y33_06845 [Spirochaetes bacterium GWF1_51_8]|nr:MAG: hypothetical protein A2Y33_06845 [Spirochaetes bacterium GWF1_51_8]